jgi:hypothetical protein
VYHSRTELRLRAADLLSKSKSSLIIRLAVLEDDHRFSRLGLPTRPNMCAGLPWTTALSECEEPESSSFAESTKRLADAPLRPKVEQKPADVGLFSDEHKQIDLVDVLRSKERGR